jgi:hypothetical protein
MWNGFYWLRVVAGEGSCGSGAGFHGNADSFLTTRKKSLAFKVVCSMEFRGLLVC